MNEIVPDRIIRVPIEAITKPLAGMCEVMLEHWWIVDPATDSVVFYQRHNKKYSYPQCNRAESITRKVLLGMWEPFGFEVRLVPVAFIPIWMTGEVDFGYQLVRLLKKEEDGDGSKT